MHFNIEKGERSLLVKANTALTYTKLEFCLYPLKKGKQKIFQLTLKICTLKRWHSEQKKHEPFRRLDSDPLFASEGPSNALLPSSHRYQEKVPCLLAY